jgi:hypothetical protein
MLVAVAENWQRWSLQRSPLPFNWGRAATAATATNVSATLATISAATTIAMTAAAVSFAAGC